MMPLKIFLGTLVLFSQLAQAEYRAFELVITNSESGKEKVIVSTLDPFQYVGYYPIEKNESITYRDTWRCPGNTSGHQPICNKPEGEQRSGSS